VFWFSILFLILAVDSFATMGSVNTSIASLMLALMGVLNFLDLPQVKQIYRE